MMNFSRQVAHQDAYDLMDSVALHCFVSSTFAHTMKGHNDGLMMSVTKVEVMVGCHDGKMAYMASGCHACYDLR